MKPGEILEMLDEGRIEELKSRMKEEVKLEEVKNIPGGNARYKAMKEFYKHVKDEREYLSYALELTIGGEPYHAIYDPYSIAFTKESIGTIPVYHKWDAPDIQKFLAVSVGDSPILTVDMEKILSDAKKQGYRHTVKEMQYGKGGRFYLEGTQSFFKLGFVDKVFSIINDGNPARVFEVPKLMYIKTSLGMAVVLGLTEEPFYQDDLIKIPLSKEE